MASVSFCHHLISAISLFPHFSYFKLLLEKYRTGNQTGSDVPYEFRTRILSLVLIRHKHWRHRTLKFLIGQSFKNVFSRTEEGICSY
jgi:hypothetical protein